MYLKMIKGEEDPVYIKLYTKFQSLVNRDTSFDKTNTYGISYMETTPILKFEHINGTIVVFFHDEGGKRHAEFILGEKKQYATIMTVVNTDEVKENLAISNCRNAKGERFWLIHLLDKVTMFKPKPIDIDELNNDLDLLLSTRYG